MSAIVHVPPDATRAPVFARGDHVEVADHLVATFGANENLTFTEGDFYRFDDVIYSPVHRSQLSRIVQDFAGAPVASNSQLRIKASDVKGAVTLASDQCADPEFFTHASPGIAFQSSFVEVKSTGILVQPNSMRFRARVAYDFDFEHGAQPVRFIEFFRQVFRDDCDAEQKIAFLQEHAGMSLIGCGARYQRAVVMPGSGENGKSTAVSIIERCMPAGSVVAIPPQDLDQDYKRAMLVGKRLNIVGELPENEIVSSESWKAIVDGLTRVTARSPYKEPFTFVPIAGHIYSANRLPGSTDHTRGFWRRWVVVPFNRRFADSEKDAGLADRIVLTERAAIVAWLIEGARRALVQGRYTIPPSSEVAIKEWRRTADQVACFVEEEMVTLEQSAPYSDWLDAKWFYQYYRGWADRNGHRPVANSKFGERMHLLALSSHRLNSGYVYPVKVK